MTTATLTRPEALIAEWRTSAEGDHPAGPLFSSPFAQAELTSLDMVDTFNSCSSCTASRTASCC